MAADHALASQAGRDQLRSGGNAVDAAVAAALMAGVVQPAGSGLGGGGFAVVAGPAEPYVLDFRESAPAGARRDLYVGPDAPSSRVGPSAVAVPGESRGLARLLRDRGSRSPSQVAAPAIRAARRGFVVGDHLARALAAAAFPGVVAQFTVGGEVASAGVHVRNPALASTLRRWASSGGEDLHTGRGARAVAGSMGESGLITDRDLRDYAPAARAPIVAHFKGYTLYTMPPPSSGGVVLGQALAVLEGYDLAALGHNSSDSLHLIVEALKHGFADRAHHLGDPDFVDVPTERLLSDARITQIRQAIWPARTFEPTVYGPPIAPPRDGGTQHISVVDEHGMAVSLTSTINTAFGSGLMADGLGFPLNNEMDDFALAPGVPNAYGLVGAEANAVAPGKRPLSSMSPTVVLDEQGRAVMAIGASGGSTIISSTLQVFLNLTVYGLDAQEAVSAPRVHHQWLPDALFVEDAMPRDVVDNLRARGHAIKSLPTYSSVQVVVAREGGLEGASDPRKGGWPAAISGAPVVRPR